MIRQVDCTHETARVIVSFIEGQQLRVVFFQDARANKKELILSKHETVVLFEALQTLTPRG